MACDTRKSPERRGPGLKFRRPTILTDNARCRAVMAVTDKIAAIASAPDPNAKLAQVRPKPTSARSGTMKPIGRRGLPFVTADRRKKPNQITSASTGSGGT